MITYIVVCYICVVLCFVTFNICTQEHMYAYIDLQNHFDRTTYLSLHLTIRFSDELSLENNTGSKVYRIIIERYLRD